MFNLADLLPAIGAIGGLAFLVGVVTEVTKNLGFLKRIPTDLQVIVLSVALSVVAVSAYLGVKGYQASWWMIVGAVFGGFIVAFISMYGWTTLMDLAQRFGLKLDKEGNLSSSLLTKDDQEETSNE